MLWAASAAQAFDPVRIEERAACAVWRRHSVIRGETSLADPAGYGLVRYAADRNPMRSERLRGMTVISAVAAMYALWNIAVVGWMATVSNESHLAIRSVPGSVLAALSAICAVGCWRVSSWAPTAFAALFLVLVSGGWMLLPFFEPTERAESFPPLSVASCLIAILGLWGFRYVRAATRSAA